MSDLFKGGELTKISTWQVLRNKFPESEYVLIEEVSDASGFNRSGSMDFMIINLWPSRGLSVTGIERKSNRADWLKELKNPAKQENHFKYCDYFYLLTDKEGVAKIEEIPPTWGWYHINGNQILKTIKAAPKLVSIPIERSFLCAMLRRAASKEKYVHVDSLQEHIKTTAEKMQQEKHRFLERDAKSYLELKEKVEAFEKASGISITYSYELPKMGEVVKMIMQNGVDNYKNNLERIEINVKNIHDSILKNIGTLKEYSQDQP